MRCSVARRPPCARPPPRDFGSPSRKPLSWTRRHGPRTSRSQGSKEEANDRLAEAEARPRTGGEGTSTPRAIGARSVKQPAPQHWQHRLNSTAPRAPAVDSPEAVEQRSSDVRALTSWRPVRGCGRRTNSFDCSGLTMTAWRQAGVSLPHYSRSQCRSRVECLGPSASRRPGVLFQARNSPRGAVHRQRRWCTPRTRARESSSRTSSDRGIRPGSAVSDGSSGSSRDVLQRRPSGAGSAQAKISSICASYSFWTTPRFSFIEGVIWPASSVHSSGTRTHFLIASALDTALLASSTAP